MLIRRATTTVQLVWLLISVTRCAGDTRGIIIKGRLIDCCTFIAAAATTIIFAVVVVALAAVESER